MLGPLGDSSHLPCRCFTNRHSASGKKKEHHIAADMEKVKAAMKDKEARLFQAARAYMDERRNRPVMEWPKVTVEEPEAEASEDGDNQVAAASGLDAQSEGPQGEEPSGELSEAVAKQAGGKDGVVSVGQEEGRADLGHENKAEVGGAGGPEGVGEGLEKDEPCNKRPRSEGGGG